MADSAKTYLSQDGLFHLIEVLKANHMDIVASTTELGHVRMGAVATPTTTVAGAVAPSYHTHTSVSGNAGTATKLLNPITISLANDVIGSVTNFDGSADISILTTLKNSGAAPGTYGENTAATKAQSIVVVPTITVDAKGIVTSISSESINVAEFGGEVDLSNYVTKTELTEEATTRGDKDSLIDDEIEKLKEEIENLKYVAIAISAFTNNVNTAEVGSTVTSVTLSWTTNKTPTALTLDGSTITPTLRSTTLTGQSITTRKVFTLVATDARSATASRTTVINFYRGVYYGVGVGAPTFNSAFVLSLQRQLQGTRAASFSVTAGANQYIYFAMPADYGSPTFNVGGFDGGFALVSTFDFTNASGDVSSYVVYRSDNANLGATLVRVS